MQHKKKVTCMCISHCGQYLVSGDVQGLIYIWSTADSGLPSSPSSADGNQSSNLLTTYELHMGRGAITNLQAIQRPLSLFGLTANMSEYTVPQLNALEKHVGVESK